MLYEIYKWEYLSKELRHTTNDKQLTTTQLCQTEPLHITAAMHHAYSS